MKHSKKEVIDAIYKYCADVAADDLDFDEFRKVCGECVFNHYCTSYEGYYKMPISMLTQIEKILIKKNYLD